VRPFAIQNWYRCCPVCQRSHSYSSSMRYTDPSFTHSTYPFLERNVFIVCRTVDGRRIFKPSVEPPFFPSAPYQRCHSSNSLTLLSYSTPTPVPPVALRQSLTRSSSYPHKSTYSTSHNTTFQFTTPPIPCFPLWTTIACSQSYHGHLCRTMVLIKHQRT